MNNGGRIRFGIVIVKDNDDWISICLNWFFFFFSDFFGEDDVEYEYEWYVLKSWDNE